MQDLPCPRPCTPNTHGIPNRTCFEPPPECQTCRRWRFGLLTPELVTSSSRMPEIAAYAEVRPPEVRNLASHNWIPSIHATPLPSFPPLNGFALIYWKIHPFRARFTAESVELFARKRRIDPTEIHFFPLKTSPRPTELTLRPEDDIYSHPKHKFKDRPLHKAARRLRGRPLASWVFFLPSARLRFARRGHMAVGQK